MAKLEIYLTDIFSMILGIYSPTCIKRSPFKKKQKWYFKTGDLLKRGSIHMKFSMTGQEKGDLLIQVTTCTSLTLKALLKKIHVLFRINK